MEEDEEARQDDQYGDDVRPECKDDPHAKDDEHDPGERKYIARPGGRCLHNSNTIHPLHGVNERGPEKTKPGADKEARARYPARRPAPKPISRPAAIRMYPQYRRGPGFFASAVIRPTFFPWDDKYFQKKFRLIGCDT